MGEVGLKKLGCLAFLLCVATVIASPAQTITTLHDFDGLDGMFPRSLIPASDGNFYGTTGSGGANNGGTVFKITPEGTLTTLYNFCSLTNCADGSGPFGVVQGIDGNFYGATYRGGTELQNGTIFKITSTGVLTTLYTFCATGNPNCPDGTTPGGMPIQASDGNFYGTTELGGANGYGSIYKITPDGVLTTLYSFCALAMCSDGANPDGELLQASDGNFYGITRWGANRNSHYCPIYGCGTVFKFTTAGILTTLYGFCALANCVDGQNSQSLIQASDGNFYSTTTVGGTNGDGTVYKITPTGTLTTLRSFVRSGDGAWPYFGLVQALDGNFYGGTETGITNTWCYHGCGTVFEITPTGTLATLHEFEGLDGGRLQWLFQASDGNFYGTSASGTYGDGTIFRLTVAPGATPSPASLFVATEALDGTSSARVVTLKNSGTALLMVSSVAVEGGQFAITATSCDGATLGLGKTCKVSVNFTPTVLGKSTGMLTFTDNVSSGPQTVPLSGIGVEQATLTPSGATYAAQSVGTTSAAKTFTLSNNQSVQLTGIAVSTTGDFAVSGITCTTSLTAKSKCTINVTFTPTAIGTRTGKLTVNDSASNNPQTASLKGTGK